MTPDVIAEVLYYRTVAPPLARECERLRERVATLETTLRRTLRCPSETASNPNRRCGDPGGCQGEPCEKCRLLPDQECLQQTRAEVLREVPNA